MKDPREIGRIARNESQRALPIERLKTIKKLTGDFQVRLHSEPDTDQFVHFVRRANSERCRTDPRNGEPRWPFPNRQTADGAPLESLVFRDSENGAGNVSARLDQDELSRFLRLFRGDCTSDAGGVVRQVQSRSQCRSPYQARPDFWPNFRLTVAPPFREIGTFKLVGIDRQNRIRLLRQPFALVRRLESNR